MAEPQLINPIPAQIVNELASYGPFDLKNFIQSPDGNAEPTFSAELSNGQALPKGMILTGDGLLTGIPGKDTHGTHDIVVTATNDAGTMKASFAFTIQPSFSNKEADYIDKLKAQVWEALQSNSPMPELGGLLDLPITKLDIYYILERWGTLTIWDAFNLDPPSEKKLLTLKSASEHYHIYDRGSSLIMAPVDLFSMERTLNDGVATAKALAIEIYKRGWTIEMAGLDKWTHTAWLEFQQLGDKHGKRIEIINYTPTPEELRAYMAQSLGMMMEGNVPE